MITHLKKRWQGPAGCAEVLRLALPLIVSTSAFTVQMFVDRVFLMWHSADAMSAALQAGTTAFTFISFFFGTVIYVNTFVAQYTGARHPRRVGPAVWQGIFFSLFSGVILLIFLPLAQPIFDWVGHDPAVRQHEIIYFRIICLSAVPMLTASAVSGFFTGQGKTTVVMYVRLASTSLNIILDYCLIFGNFGFSALGVAGAAWATVFSSAFAAALFLILFMSRHNRVKFASLSGCRPDFDLFRRLMRYGLPNGIQFLLDMTAFTLFITFVGRIDKLSLGATAMAFQISYISFMPMIGLGIAVTTLVGQALGKNSPDLAQRSTWSACYLGFGYMILLSLGFWFLPHLFMAPFSFRAAPQEFALISPHVKDLLRFVAVYCLFDTGNILFSATLKGAGDTRFVMAMSVALHWTLLLIPSYLAYKFHWGLYTFWGFLTAFICILSIAFLLRFLQGKWKKMRVIEIFPPTVPPSLTVDMDVTL